MAQSRVSIIGAGPGGLAAAMLLAGSGAAVTVHERLSAIGGRSGRIEAATDVGRFRFDRGPTFFLYPAVLESIYAACGRSLREEVELIRLEPNYHLIFAGGGEMRASSNVVRMTQEIARLSLADAAALPRFLAENRAKLAAFRPVLEAPFDSWRRYLAPDVLRALPLLRPHRSVDADLARHFSDPRVRLAFSFQSKYLGMSPFRCPSLFSILAFMEHEFGVWHPRGGCSAILDSMADIAWRMGVDIRLGEPVQEILFDGRRAVGVRGARGTERADAIVLNADFAQAMATLVPNRLRRRWSDRRIARKRFSCSTFMLYLGVEGRYDDVAHHTIHLAQDYRRNVAEIEQGLLPEEPSFYVQNACVTDETLAPRGHSTLYVLVPVGHVRDGGTDWPRERARYRRLVIDRLQRIGITDLERRIRFEAMVTPPGWAQDLAIWRGATFNLAHSMGQMLNFRPHNRFEDVDGIYLVGGGTHPGSGLPTIFESARISTRLLAQDLGLTLHDAIAEDAVEAPMLSPALSEIL